MQNRPHTALVNPDDSPRALWICCSPCRMNTGDKGVIGVRKSGDDW